MAKKIVVHSFYADKECIWKMEYPRPFTEEEVQEKLPDIERMARQKPEVMTDTTGRLMYLK